MLEESLEGASVHSGDETVVVADPVAGEGSTEPKLSREEKRADRLKDRAEQKAAKEAAKALADDDDDEDAPKKKVKRQRPVNLEMLVKKFKSPIQGRQRKVQDWEDRTCYRLKAMGFRSVPSEKRTSDFCTFELECGTIRAIIRSEHSQWSSRGLVKFTDSAPKAPPTEPSTEG